MRFAFSVATQKNQSAEINHSTWHSRNLSILTGFKMVFYVYNGHGGTAEVVSDAEVIFPRNT